MSEVPWRAKARGCEIDLRVTPKSGRDEVKGLHRASDGRLSLQVKVRALPNKGEANAAALATLAKALGVPRSRLALIRGATSRDKTVAVAGDARELERLIGGLMSRIEGETN